MFWKLPKHVIVSSLVPTALTPKSEPATSSPWSTLFSLLGCPGWTFNFVYCSGVSVGIGGMLIVQWIHGGMLIVQCNHLIRNVLIYFKKSNVIITGIVYQCYRSAAFVSKMNHAITFNSLFQSQVYSHPVEWETIYINMHLLTKARATNTVCIFLILMV